MREIALHLLDIAENSVAANAKNITLTVCEDLQGDRLTASVIDDGKGMSAEMTSSVMDPFVTSRTTRKVGLGIPLFKAAAESCNGNLIINSEIGKGTKLDVDFQHSHIDRMPLGDLSSTILTLFVAYPKIHWLFDYKVIPANGMPKENFVFDTQPVMAELGDISLTEPAVLAFIREFIESGVTRVRATSNS
ncbi:MAG: sensor histidine kinase [Actinobacteria bacterium]|nr:sensor histidine kinase [Actinomycetota bacterium]